MELVVCQTMMRDDVHEPQETKISSNVCRGGSVQEKSRRLSAFSLKMY